MKRTVLINRWSVSIGYLKLELLDHGLAAEAQQQIIGCQGGHLIAGEVPL